MAEKAFENRVYWVWLTKVFGIGSEYIWKLCEGYESVKHARRLGEPALALPPVDISDSRYFGQRNLIREGAGVCFDANDILSRLKQGGRAADIPSVEVKPSPVQPEPSEQESAAKDKKSAKVRKNPAEDLNKNENSVTIDISALSEQHQQIYRLLEEKGTLHLNQIAEQLGIAVYSVMNDLLVLQMKGIITQLPGKLFEIK